MNQEVSENQIQAAQAYEDLYVPALFRQWAERLTNTIAPQPDNRILDVACGTGILARQIAESLGSTGFVAGVDPLPGMLAVAERSAPSIEWRLGTAEAIPYPDNNFDAVVCQFGLMFFTDRIQSLREFLRVLNPQGKIAVAVWATLENTEAYPIVVELLERLAGVPAADALKAPFVLGDKTELYDLFKTAGIESIEITSHHGPARFPNARTMVEADLRGWLPVMGVDLSEQLIQQILTEAERELKDYIRENGEVVFDSPAHIVTGRKSN